MENEEPQDNGEAAAGDGEKSGDKQAKGERKPATLKEQIIRVVSVGNVGMQAFSIATVVGMPCKGLSCASSGAKMAGQICGYSSAGIGVANSPVVVMKERQLTKEDTFRTALNGIREQQGRLAEQNDILSAEIDDLQSEVDRLKDVENALRELSETQGSQLNELMDLIGENKEINEGMRMVLRNKVLQDFISLVLDIDNDGSFTIQDKEIDRLLIGMRIFPEITGFDENLFRKELSDCGGNVDEVITLLKSMLNMGDGGGDAECKIELSDPTEFFNRQRSSGGV